VNPTTAVIGAGAWGTTLAMVLAHRGQTVRLWEFFPDYARVLDRTRENPKFLPGVRIPEGIPIVSDLGSAARDADVLVMAVPAQRTRGVAHALAAAGARPGLVVSAAKGIEQGSLARMSEVLAAEFGDGPGICALSGPSHAEEVSRRKPCSLVAASVRPEAARRTQDLFMTDWVRVYTHDDVVGVELGASVKNVMAIAAGAVDGLELGDNAKAALVTRGLAEMARLGRALGARDETFAGLSGMGDLIVTCMSRHSRNRRVGEELGRGRSLDEVLRGMEMVAEGVDTARSTRALAKRLGVEMPITEVVNRMCFEGLQATEAVGALMQRTRRPESDPA
jgi:glycerol-3-phosphate dehydrogenase (NAD(P)+)